MLHYKEQHTFSNEVANMLICREEDWQLNDDELELLEIAKCLENGSYNSIESSFTKLSSILDKSIPFATINDYNFISLILKVLFDDEYSSLCLLIICVLTKISSCYQVNVELLSTKEFFRGIVKFRKLFLGEIFLGFFCTLLKSNENGCKSFDSIGFIDFYYESIINVPLLIQEWIIELFCIMVKSRVENQQLMSFLSIRMKKISIQDYDIIHLIRIAFENNYKNDIDCIELFKPVLFNSENKSIEAFHLIKYLFIIKEKETLSYFTWNAFDDFLNIETHSEKSIISFCKMINAIFETESQLLISSFEHKIDDFLINYLHDSSFKVKVVILESLGYLAKINLDILLKKNYYDILIEYLNIGDINLLPILISSLTYLINYVKINCYNILQIQDINDAINNILNESTINDKYRQSLINLYHKII